MSIRVVSAVWDLDLPSRPKLVLLALADWAGDDGGRIFPSVARIAEKSRMSERAVQRHLARLRDCGILETVAYPNGGRGKATEYRIALAALPERVPNWHRIDSGKGANSVEIGCHSEQKETPNGDSSGTPTVRENNRHKPLVSRKRATRVPEVPLPESWLLFARTLKLDAKETHERFLDYWRAIPGRQGTKLDWDATWRNWCRNEKTRAAPKLMVQRERYQATPVIPSVEETRRMMRAKGLA